jgi:hypothetical protein
VNGVPPEAFPNAGEWEHQGQLTTGVLLAAGPRARAVGILSLNLYDAFQHRLRHAEQTAFSSVMLESGEPYLPLGYWQVCQCEEEHLDGPVGNERYVTGTPCVDGRQITFRHFLRTGAETISTIQGELRARFPW